MKIRALVKEDMEEVKRLHEKFFGDQFLSPDFMDHYLNAFIIEHDNKIVMAGGIRAIAETILVTDKEANAHLLGKCLLEALRVSMYTCAVNDIELLHAFVKDEAYKKHLIAHGFSPRCQALYLSV